MQTEEIINTLTNIKIGDKLSINDWHAPYTVCGISKRYVLAHYGRHYTIIRRRPVTQIGYSRNGVRYGDIVCAPDWWALGYPDGYDFTNQSWVMQYMADLEADYTGLSMRRMSPVFFLSVIGHTDKVYAKKKAPEGANKINNRNRSNPCKD